jgi:uncharacterized membrane-anchored protein
MNQKCRTGKSLVLNPLRFVYNLVLLLVVGVGVPGVGAVLVRRKQSRVTPSWSHRQTENVLKTAAQRRK